MMQLHTQNPPMSTAYSNISLGGLTPVWSDLYLKAYYVYILCKCTNICFILFTDVLLLSHNISFTVTIMKVQAGTCARLWRSCIMVFYQGYTMIECCKGRIHYTGLYLLIGTPGGISLSPKGKPFTPWRPYQQA